MKPLNSCLYIVLVEDECVHALFHSEEPLKGIIEFSYRFWGCSFIVILSLVVISLVHIEFVEHVLHKFHGVVIGAFLGWFLFFLLELLLSFLDLLVQLRFHLLCGFILGMLYVEAATNDVEPISVTEDWIVLVDNLEGWVLKDIWAVKCNILNGFECRWRDDLNCPGFSTM